MYHFRENLNRTISEILMRKISMITKHFGNIKPFFSDKVKSTNKMTLIDKEEMIVGDYNTTNVLNVFFSNIASNRNIVQYSNCEPHANNIKDPFLKWFEKYRNPPIKLAV